MLFSRKNPKNWREALRQALSPRDGYVRLFQRMGLYFWHRLMRLRHHPHQVALGVAIGVFVSFSPFIGLHGPISVVLALSLRGSLLAAFMAQGVGNPVTFPVIWFASWKMGSWVTGLRVPEVDLASLSWAWVGNHWYDLAWFLVPFTLGGLILGGVIGAISYVFVHQMMRFQRSR